MADNQVTLVGNLTRDPEERVTTTGVTIVEIGLAVNSRRRVGDEWVEDPNFFNCTIFEDQGMNVARCLNKGDRVIVVGRLRWSAWEDQEGKKQTRVTITVDEIGPALRWATIEGLTRIKGSKAGVSAPSGTKKWDEGEEPF